MLCRYITQQYSAEMLVVHSLQLNLFMIRCQLLISDWSFSDSVSVFFGSVLIWVLRVSMCLLLFFLLFFL